MGRFSEEVVTGGVKFVAKGTSAWSMASRYHPFVTESTLLLPLSLGGILCVEHRLCRPGLMPKTLSLFRF